MWECEDKCSEKYWFHKKHDIQTASDKARANARLFGNRGPLLVLSTHGNIFDHGAGLDCVGEDSNSGLDFGCHCGILLAENISILTLEATFDKSVDLKALRVVSH